MWFLQEQWVWLSLPHCLPFHCVRAQLEGHHQTLAPWSYTSQPPKVWEVNVYFNSLASGALLQQHRMEGAYVSTLPGRTHHEPSWREAGLGGKACVLISTEVVATPSALWGWSWWSPREVFISGVFWCRSLARLLGGSWQSLHLNEKGSSQWMCVRSHKGPT